MRGVRQVSLPFSGTAGSAPGAKGQSYIPLLSVPGRAAPDYREYAGHGPLLVTGRFIHTAPQEQMDAPDASGAESLAPQAVIETGDGVFGQFCQ